MKEVLCVLVIFVTTIRTQTTPCTIDNIQISVDTSGVDVVASWTYDTDCLNIFYSIAHHIDNTLVQSIPQLHATQFNLEKRICSTNSVTVTVRTQAGVIETASHNFVVGQNNPVENLRYDDGRFVWEPPIAAGTCIFTYNVVWNNEPEEDIEETYFPVTLLPCTNTITVSPVVLGIRGPSEQNVRTIPPTNVGPVRELQFNNDRFEWKRPDNTLRCPVTYEVRFQNALGEVVRDIEVEYFVFDLHPCTLNNIEVIPIVLTIRGEPRQLSHTVPPQMNAPVHVFTEPNTSEAVGVWRLDRPEGNVCEIRGFVATLSSSSTHVGIFDDESTTATVTISGLTLSERYSYSTRWILDDEIQSGPSEDIIFLAEPLSPPDITVESITANGFIISWEQNIDTEFIQGYRVVITPNGPLHFLPEGCDQDENVISYDINDNSENQYEFLDGQPSFSYTVELFTIFTVALERSAAETIETLETDPGKLTISSQMEYENDVRYVASANIIWPVPCDVNGFIQNFTYKITGNMNFADRENCQMIELNGVVTEMDYKNTYSIRVNDLIPFLRYRVDVTTNLRAHSSITSKTFDPPAIYTPPIA